MKKTVFACLLVACAAVAQTDSRPSQPAARQDLHAPFDALLRAHVHGELVDYLTWRDHDADELRAYLDALAAVDPAALGRDARLAFYLNLYNATMIDAILHRVDAGYTTAAGDWRVFDEKLVRLRGERISLNSLEHDIVRARFDDPRIHAALVCGARSCPPLLPRAYRGEDLDTVLDAAMRRFVRDPSRNRLDGEGLALSKIFDWYAADFGGEDGVRAWIARYAGDEKVAGGPLGYLEYSWQLNIASPASGRWISLREPAAGLAAGAVCEVLDQRDGELRVRLPFDRGEVSVPARATSPYPPR